MIFMMHKQIEKQVEQWNYLSTFWASMALSCQAISAMYKSTTIPFTYAKLWDKKYD